jgi:hypothetical protein
MQRRALPDKPGRHTQHCAAPAITEPHCNSNRNRTMQAIELSIVVLTAGDPERARRIADAYAASDICSQLRVQFVFLMNRKDLSFPLANTQTTMHDDVETVYVGNDRYFGSCEENLYRLRDILDIVKPLVLVIGETDEINWRNLVSAARIATDGRHDALLLNTQNIQRKRDGGSSSMFAVHNLNEDSLQNQIFRMLISGRVLGSNLAYPAVASMFGPLDWLAFIGNHLYSRSALRGILKYRFTEHVYSFVYMQALYFSGRAGRYQLFTPEVVNRISNDFLSEKVGKVQDFGWLREHRTVHGQSQVLWISNIHHLLQIEDDALFAVLAMSLNLAFVPSGQNDGINLNRNSMLRQLIWFTSGVIQEKFNGHSFYLKTPGRSRLDDELWAILRFFRRLLKTADMFGGDAASQFVEKTSQAVTFMSLYFDDVEGAPELLNDANDALNDALKSLDDTMLRHFHTTSFKCYSQAIAA